VEGECGLVLLHLLLGQCADKTVLTQEGLHVGWGQLLACRPVDHAHLVWLSDIGFKLYVIHPNINIVLAKLRAGSGVAAAYPAVVDVGLYGLQADHLLVHLQ